MSKNPKITEEEIALIKSAKQVIHLLLINFIISMRDLQLKYYMTS